MKIGNDFLPLSPTNGFIVFEGVNGAGKSTLIQNIKTVLAHDGITVMTSREPGATPLGKVLRSVVMEQEEESLSPRTELFVFAADRAHHVDTVLRPALKEKTFILCDRYYYSTLAFQGFGRGIDRNLVTEISRIAIDGLVPDLVVLLDLPPDVGLARIAAQKGSHAKDTFESEQLSFHTKVRDGFLALAETLPEPFLVLDATKSPEALQEQTLGVLRTILRHREP